MPRITKLAVLIDPNKVEESERVYLALLEIINKHDHDAKELPLEIWVGDTKEIFRGVHEYLKKLHNAEIPDYIKRVIFPGHPLQISKYADHIMIPSLLNTYSTIMKTILRIGTKYHWLFKWFSRFTRRNFPTERKFGYMILNNQSSVGRKLKAKNITDEEAITMIKSSWKKKWEWIYLEAGSGNFADTVGNRIELIRETAQIAHDNKSKLIVGGGIKTSEHVKGIVEADCDIVVVSSAFEVLENPKSLIEEFLDIVEEKNK